jgi:enoyl-CoA hydratase/carnithine racemase
MAELIQLDESDRIRTITLNRPEKKNALTREMYDALSSAIKAANADHDVDVICITGAGDAFTAGNDLQDFVASPPPVSLEVGPGGLFAALRSSEKPVIAAVNGMAVGIGTTMLLHCDLVYATSRARFKLPFAAIGLVPEGGSTKLLPELVGHRRASEALLFGDWIDASQAKAWGIVNDVFDDEAQLKAAVRERAERLARLPSRLVRLTLAMLKTPSESLQHRMDEELGLLSQQINMPEAQEAFAAMREKRPADFQKLANRKI